MPLHWESMMFSSILSAIGKLKEDIRQTHFGKMGHEVNCYGEVI